MLKVIKEYKLHILTAVLLVAGISSLFMAGGCNVSDNSKAPKPASRATLSEVGGELDIRNAFIKVAELTGPAVVSIYTEATRKVEARPYPFGRPGGSPFRDPFFDDFFKRFFKDVPQEREFKQTGLGSGVIIDKQGYVLTNEHVIRGADKITVALPDGRQFPGMVKGTDSRSDLAVIKIEAKKIPVAVLGNSDLVQTGEWAVAIGNPFGYLMKSPEPTVTVGVISALHRSLPQKLPGYTDLIQTDAAINPGNSGGPLCDINGNVVGINVAIFSQSGGYQGIGFAIPINYAKNILDTLKEGKEVVYGWLGVSIQDLNQELADYFGISDRQGALIASVMENSPASKGGLKKGDVIKTFNNDTIKNTDDLLRIVSRAKVGETAKLKVVRNKKDIALAVKITKRPAEPEITKSPESGAEEEAPASWRGITAVNITENIAAQLRLTNRSGVVIAQVEPGSAAHEAGLKRGDAIREIGKSPITNIKDFKKVTELLEGNILLNIDRGYMIIKEK